MKVYGSTLAVGIVLGALSVLALTPEKEIEIVPEIVEVFTKDDSKDLFYGAILKEVFGVVPTAVYNIPVTVTAYSARAKETNSEPWWTADMTLSRVGILAVSRDILNEVGLEYGDTVILGDYGVFKIHDTMNKRFKRRVDILMGNAKAANKFGIHHNIKLSWFNKSS